MSDYLLSVEWEFRRLMALETAGYRCQVCNSFGPILDVHHRTYERYGHEEPGDLTVLCRTCHDIFHQNRKVAR